MRIQQIWKQSSNKTDLEKPSWDSVRDVGAHIPLGSVRTDGRRLQTCDGVLIRLKCFLKVMSHDDDESSMCMASGSLSDEDATCMTICTVPALAVCKTFDVDVHITATLSM